MKERSNMTSNLDDILAPFELAVI